MKTKTSMQGRDLYMRGVDEKGAVTHSQHRVWDASLFMAAREREAANLNAKKDSIKASATQLTVDQYEARA